MTKLLAVLILLSLSTAALYAGPFDDVPKDHWAYNAIDLFKKAGIPESKQAYTRYDFAVAVARLVSTIKKDNTKASAFNKSDLDMLGRLVKEFKDELAALGVDVDAVKRDVCNTLEPQPISSRVHFVLPEPSSITKSLSSQSSDSKTWKASFKRGTYLEEDHWSYQSLSILQKCGKIKGYPDNAFNGKRIFTRRQLAYALTKALPLGPEDSWTRESISAIQQLVDEFRDELANYYRVDVDQLKADILHRCGNIQE